MIVENFWLFAVAGLLLNLTPGNDMLYAGKNYWFTINRIGNQSTPSSKK